ncbi:MAG: ATP synthase F0 subunit B [Planctomycetes bacterium]|nr:ATP synthase F0 subunit B [Planctomycetota bacterium]
MRPYRVSVCFAVLAGLSLAAPVRAAGEKSTKFTVEYTGKDGKEHLKTFDFAKPADKEEVAALVREGHVHFLEPARSTPDLISWDLGLWTVVVFVLLFIILKKAAWGPMLDGLKKREDNIRASVEEAKLARAETERIRAEFKAEMAKAYEQIPKMMDEARRDGQALVEQMRSQAVAEIQAEKQRTRRELEVGLEQALQELTQHAAQLATLISAKAIQRSLTEDDHRRLVDLALTEIKEAKR